jgi:hypothetical protein
LHTGPRGQKTLTFATCPHRAHAHFGHDLPAELAVVSLIDMTPSRVVAVWNEGDTNPLIRSFIEIATAAYRR